VTIDINLDLNPLIQGMNQLIKATEQFNQKTKTSEKDINSLNAKLETSGKNFMKFGRSVGMTKSQLNTFMSTIKSISSSSIKASQTFYSLDKRIGSLNKTVANLTSTVKSQSKEIDRLTSKLNSYNSSVNRNSKSHRINKLTLRDWIYHAQRLLRYYALMRLSMRAYHEVQNTIVTGATFQQSILTLSGVLRSTVKEIDPLVDRIRFLGATTEWTSTQVAEAAKLLAMAGLEMRQVMIALEGTLRLATAGNIDLAKAADISTNILSAFGLEVEQLGRVNDVLIGTITRTNSTIIELSEAMKYAAPVAKAFGYEIEQTSAMLGILHNMGLKGSQAGTGLARAMFQTSKVFRELRSSTVSLEDRLGSGKAGLLRALEGIKKEAWDSEKILKIFGDRGAKTALIFLDLNSQIVDLEEKLKNSKNESRDLADVMRSSLIKEFNTLQSAIDDIRIDIVNDNLGLLQDILTSLKKFIKENKEEFKNLGTAILQLGQILIFLADNLRTVSNAIGLVTLALILFIGKGPLAVEAAIAIKIAMGFLTIAFNYLQISMLSAASGTGVLAFAMSGLIKIIGVLKVALTALAVIMKAHPILFIVSIVLLIVTNLDKLSLAWKKVGEAFSWVVDKIKAGLNIILELLGSDFKFKITPVIDYDALRKIKDSWIRGQGGVDEGRIIRDKTATEVELKDLKERQRQTEKLRKEIINLHKIIEEETGLDKVTSEYDTLIDLQNQGIQLTEGQVQLLKDMREARAKYYSDLDKSSDLYYKGQLSKLNEEYNDYWSNNLRKIDADNWLRAKTLQLDEKYYNEKYKQFLEYYKLTGSKDSLERSMKSLDKSDTAKKQYMVEFQGMTSEEADRILKTQREQIDMDLNRVEIQSKYAKKTLDLNKKLVNFGEWETSHWDIKRRLLETEKNQQLELYAGDEKRKEITADYESQLAQLNAEELETMRDKARYIDYNSKAMIEILDIERQIEDIGNNQLMSTKDKYGEIIRLTEIKKQIEIASAKTGTEALTKEIEGNVEILELKKQQRIEQNKALQELENGLAVAIAQMAAMAAEGENTSQSFRTLLTTIGSVVGSYYGPVGSIIGGAIGTVAGNVLAPDIVKSPSLEDAIRDLELSINDLNVSIVDFDKSLKFNESTNLEHLGSLLSILPRIAELQRKSQMGFQEWVRSVHPRFKYIEDSVEAEYAWRKMREAALNELRALITSAQPIINALAEAASQSRQYITSLIEEINDINFKKEQESWTSSDWTSYLDTLATQALSYKSGILTESQLSAYGSTSSAAYITAKAMSDYNQYMFGQIVEDYYNAEQAMVDSLEATVSALESNSETIKSLRTSLLNSTLNPNQSFAYVQSRYQELLSAANQPNASQTAIDNYLGYVNTYLERSRDYFKNADEYAMIFNKVVGETGDLATIEETLNSSIIDLTLAINNLSGTLGLINGFADGGIVNNPTYSMIGESGPEAVIPLKNGSVPVSMSGTSGNSRIESLLESIAVGIHNGSNISIVIDGGKFDSRIEKIADNNRVRAYKQNMSGRSLVL